MGEFTTLPNILAWPKLKQEQRDVVAAALGEECIDYFTTICALADLDWATAAQSLNGLAKTRLNLMAN